MNFSLARTLALTVCLLHACAPAQAPVASAPPSTSEPPTPAAPAKAPTDERATVAPKVAVPLLEHGPESPARPRFSPDGQRIAFHAGPDGAHKVYVLDLRDRRVQQVSDLAGDSRDPTWDQGGARVVFANNAEGSYDLYVAAPGQKPERVTRLPGDELEPTVAPVRFTFSAVYVHECGGGAGGEEVDGYEKVAFTRRHGEPAREEVWFASLREPGAAESRVKRSAHGTHSGRLSPEGASCREPAFSRDGLSLVWSCGDGVRDGHARFDHTFLEALEAVKFAKPDACLTTAEDYDEAKCLARLKKRYASYPGSAVSSAGDGVARPSVSANQIVLVGDRAGEPVHREREGERSVWQPFAFTAVADVRNVVWAPDGKTVAFDAAGPDGRMLYTLATDFYLQEVENLHEFPELHGKGHSDRLQQNRFVVRPGDQKEFYALYEQLRYRRRPQFVTADAALQAYRDEMLRAMQRAEGRASRDLRALSRALFDHYLARDGQSPEDHYLAVSFATAWTVLEAAARLAGPSAEDLQAEGVDPADEAVAARIREQSKPAIERLPAQVKRVVARLSPKVRAEVETHVRLMLAHAEIENLTVPGRDKPVRVDYTQFSVRGPYAEGKLIGYFLAVSWFSQAPIPATPALSGLLSAMETVKIKNQSAYDLYLGIDALISTFMGKPVDATLQHVRALRTSNPELFEPFQAAEVHKRLEAMRGPMPLRDAEAAENRESGRALRVTLLPKRAGYDTTVFRAVTDDATRIPWPSALDPFAVLGSERAGVHGFMQQHESLRPAYQGAIAKMRAEEPRPGKGFYGTDIYHGWLATLVALANAHDVPSDSLLTFAKSDAWHDRLLSSALSGYTQLKHAATLYNMQDNSAECDFDVHYSVLVEQPVLATPRGYVDPLPDFFDALASLADRVYREIDRNEKGPAVTYWGESAHPLNARNFARDLATIARHELGAKPLTDAQVQWIESVGGRLEALTLTVPKDSAMQVSGEARARRGVAIATDIHTNVMRGEALEIAIGRIDPIYVAVPAEVGQRMTQGGVFSFYEFTEPMATRLTDEAWGERLERQDLPPRPAFTSSFFEHAPK